MRVSGVNAGIKFQPDLDVPTGNDGMGSGDRLFEDCMSARGNGDSEQGQGEGNGFIGAT
jgi:hypothetical protein